jgi:hypothetical protein
MYRDEPDERDQRDGGMTDIAEGHHVAHVVRAGQAGAHAPVPRVPWLGGAAGAVIPPIPWRGRVAGAVIPLLLFACARKPPADFAPDPGLVARITALRIEVPPVACPGQTIPAAYVALLDDGSELPFATSYDEDHPPALHVVFLSRHAEAATPLGNGNWSASPDPLTSATDGFRLRALVRAKPDVRAEAVVAPEYSCLDHTLVFSGTGGHDGGAGGPGPSVTVRVGLLSSPFVDRLIVAEVSVERAPPVYLLADAEAVPPSDWLQVAAVGGRGGRGTEGSRGPRGVAGRPGCPGGSGGAGGAGGHGGPGGDGGTGGHVAVIVPEDEPFLAGLVEVRTGGGPGGAGGRPGKGGAGGDGGAAQGDPRRCQAGTAGANGPDGRPGPDGRAGPSGPRPQVITVPATSVFGARPRAELQALLDHHAGANQ